jgi:hypothetical protein
MTQDAIRARIEQFTTELEALVRAAAIDAVTNALGGGAAPAPTRPTSTPKAAPKPTTVAAPAAPASSAKISFSRKKGSKRTPEQLAAIDAAILASVKASPGNGIEHMGKALGVPTDDLKLRVLGLVESKQIKKTGVKRATKYFPV